MLVEDPLEARPDAEQRAPHAQVARVGLELDAHGAPLVEGAPQKEVLRLDVRAGSPVGAFEPGPADLGSAVNRLDVHEARRAGGLAVDVDDERHLGLAAERLVEPAVEAERVHRGVAVDLRLALGGLAQPFPVPFVDRLDADDLSLERLFGSKVLHEDAVSRGTRDEFSRLGWSKRRMDPKGPNSSKG